MNSTANMWDDFPGWDKEYARIQRGIEEEKKSKKQELLTSTLQATYGVDFASLVSYTELTGMSTDDECEHYIDMKTQRVYSWNFMENEWENDDFDSLLGGDKLYEFIRVLRHKDPGMSYVAYLYQNMKTKKHYVSLHGPQRKQCVNGYCANLDVVSEVTSENVANNIVGDYVLE
jgi:hypothetical protein